MRDIAQLVFGSPRMTAALTTCGIAIGFVAVPIRQVMGPPALVGALSVLLLLMAASLVVRRQEIEWPGLPPISLLGFLGWAGLSIIWSEYQWATLASLLLLGAFTVIGGFIALSRDTVQIVRSFGDVLRAFLVASVVIEVFSGILIDSPLPFLEVQGRLADGGPISGFAETSDALALAAIIAAITFVVEWRMRSVSRGVAVGSLVLAGLVLLFASSGVAFAAVPLIGAAAGILYAIRKSPPRARSAVEAAALGVAVVGLIVAWVFRSPLLAAFGVTGEFDARALLWRRILGLSSQHPIEGFGWIGRWDAELPPYTGLVTASAPHPSAENAYVDVLLQLGVVGVVVFCGMAGLAFVRSWLLASRRRTVSFAWPALVLVALVVVSIASSAVLVEAGWATFVICCIKASGELSWRQALRRD